MEIQSPIRAPTPASSTGASPAGSSFARPSSNTGARAFYEARRTKGKSHHTALRALAAKWQRILFRCWLTRTPFDETTYIHSLIVSGSPLTPTLTRDIDKC